MKLEHTTNSFIQWFRDSSPYIHAHRGRTLVLMVPGEVVESDNFNNLIHDIALLNSLGIRLVLVHGARPQINIRLKKNNIKCEFKHCLRITDNEVLQEVKSCVGHIRVEIEALLSQGLINTPMAGASIRVASGNFVSAKPIGIKDGTDYQQTGAVRRIDVSAIEERLDGDNIVLLSPLGYSPSGEVFNLNSEDLAFELASALHADKLIYLVNSQALLDEHKKIISQFTIEQAQTFIDSDANQQTDIKLTFENAIKACRSGVKRVHLVDQFTDGALLIELFSRDGCGTLIGARNYESIRAATVDDIAGIIELIRPLEESGTLVRRSRELLEAEIDHFSVVERDGMIVACAALYPFEKEHKAELACMATHPNYSNQGFADQLLNFVQAKAKNLQVKTLFALTTSSSHWFVERGFSESNNELLPASKQALYNYQRNSKVFVKPL